MNRHLHFSTATQLLPLVFMVAAFAPEAAGFSLLNAAFDAVERSNGSDGFEEYV